MKKILNIALPILLVCSLVVVLLNSFAPTYLPWNPKAPNTQDLAVISENFKPEMHHLDFRAKFRDAEIPDVCEILGESNLRFDIWSIDLADNGISDIPEIECLENLKELNLSYNNFTDFPEFDLSNSLEILNLSNNKLSNIDNISRYLKVGEVQLSYNQFETIDATLLPPNVIELSLQHNEIRSLTGFASLKWLKSLKLEFNQLTDTVFDDLEPVLPNLLILTLAENSISAEKVKEWNEKSYKNMNPTTAE